MKLRPDQQKLSAEIDNAWNEGSAVVMASAPCGWGKTVLFSDKMIHSRVPSIAIAHRQELVAQMSLTLARNGLEHRVIAADKTRHVIERMHMKYLGRRWINPRAQHAAAGVDTLRLMPDDDPYLRSIGFWVGDEGHHFLKENKWGKAVSKLGPQIITPGSCRGLLVTATPGRSDGKGLGSHADGLADTLIFAPDMRSVINAGNLTDYKLHAPQPSGAAINYADIPLSAGGDFSPEPLKAAVKRSSIVGDVVKAYLEIAPGQQGITFAVDLDHARELCQAYRDAGVKAMVISSEMDTTLRADIMRQFAERSIQQLVNVDILGEGTDCPACSVVSFARPTCSLPLYIQQFNRALRLMVAPELMARWGDMSPEERKRHIAASDKPHAHVIDHVRNWERHSLPDSPRRWSLDRRDKAKRTTAPDDVIPVRTCLHKDEETEVTCVFVYERTLAACPACGHAPTPSGRSRPEEVDGDLFEIDPAVLAALRGEAERIMDPPVIPGHLTGIARQGAAKHHNERKRAQIELGDVIDLWAGWQMAQGRDAREAYKRFYFAFGVDVATARTLNRADAESLAARVRDVLQCNHVVNINYLANVG